MKRIFAFFMCVLLLFLLAACGTSETNSEQSTQPPSTPSSSVDKTKEEESSTATTDFLGSTYKVPLLDIYVDVPTYQQMEKGFTEIFIEHDVKFVAFTALRKQEASTNEIAHSKTFEVFKDNIHNYCHISSFNFLTTKTETINEIDVYYYEGTLNCEENPNSYIVGYSFVFENVPCNITGAVIAKEQKDTMKDEIKEVVFSMMKSVRSVA